MTDIQRVNFINKYQLSIYKSDNQWCVRGKGHQMFDPNLRCAITRFVKKLRKLGWK